MDASVGDVREFVAESREEAIAKAESFFRVGADQLEIWVVPPTVQVNGLGANVLLIAAPRGARSAPREREERQAPQREERRPEPRREARPERESRPERAERVERPERAERPARPERREPAAERPAERTAERPRERGPRPDRPERVDRPERGPRAEARPRPERPAARRPEPEPVEDVEEGELGPVGEFVAGILERMKLREVAITEAETDDGDIIISLAGKSIAALADREPRLAAALSHLAHRAAEMLVDEEAAARVEIKGTRRPQQDDGNERSGRDSRRDGRRPERGADRDRGRDSDDRDVDEVALERMAREGAEIVRRTGEPELLRPMNSRERWVVHNALKDERGVRSESEGEGPRKRVRITPD